MRPGGRIYPDRLIMAELSIVMLCPTVMVFMLLQMPRRYKRKSNRSSWTKEALQNAIRNVETGDMSVRQASKQFDIPRRTLRDRLANKNFSSPRPGKRCVFTGEQEEQLVKHTLLLSQAFHGLNVTSFRRLVYDFAEKNFISHPFDKNTKLAGKDWYYEFMKRHEKISLRKPEATSINRIVSFNKDSVEMFFDNLKSIQAEYNFQPNDIFNVDESGLSTVQVPQKVLAAKGMHQCGRITSAERGQLTTVICAMSASGTVSYTHLTLPTILLV